MQSSLSKYKAQGSSSGVARFAPTLILYLHAARYVQYRRLTLVLYAVRARRMDGPKVPVITGPRSQPTILIALLVVRERSELHLVSWGVLRSVGGFR